jgi:tRNA(Arg) A34 adenosine deaminase TadA
VDPQGAIVCFALNRNVVLNSTMAHAEARAVGAAIVRANDKTPQNATPSWTFGALLRGDTLYDTLEPCAQCAGIMDLANIGTVVYAQDDPETRGIANVLYNLQSRPGEPGASLPIRANFLPVWDALEAAYRRFLDTAPLGGRTGLTSFLQTVEAYRLYTTAAHAFDTLQATHPENAPLLREARVFRARWADRLRDDPLGIVRVPLVAARCPDGGNAALPGSPLGVPVCDPGR